jgi:hypothetical protein
MKLSELKVVLRDARFIKIVEILNDYNSLLAIYLIRLITKKSLSFSKKYISRLDIFKQKMRNPMQYWDKK